MLIQMGNGIFVVAATHIPELPRELWISQIWDTSLMQEPLTVQRCTLASKKFHNMARLRRSLCIQGDMLPAQFYHRFTDLLPRLTRLQLGPLFCGTMMEKFTHASLATSNHCDDWLMWLPSILDQMPCLLSLDLILNSRAPIKNRDHLLASLPKTLRRLCIRHCWGTSRNTHNLISTFTAFLVTSDGLPSYPKELIITEGPWPEM